MRHIIMIFIILTLHAPSLYSQYAKLEDGMVEAKRDHKKILMIFSGSDWCKPCMILKKNIISTSVFEMYVEEHLVLLELDFPYKKEHQLSPDHLAYNESLADRYNPDGQFPKVLLLDSDGGVMVELAIKKGMTVDAFLEKLKTASQ